MTKRQIEIYLLQILLAAGITIGSQSLDLDNKLKWALKIVRYVIYLLTVQASEAISVLAHDAIHRKRDLDARVFSSVNWNMVVMYTASAAILVLNRQELYSEDFPLLFIAYLIVKYPVLISVKTTVSYGVGMACSFVEGYLTYIMPPDGVEMKSFEDRFRKFEGIHNVVVPVKRLFFVITKTMRGPPDLNEFNDKSAGKDVNRLEACSSMEEVVQDVAGVKSRSYKSTVYKVVRPNARPVHVAAECATPLHTLYKAVKNKRVYAELVDVNVEEIVSDFMSTLRTVFAKHHQLKDKCELIYFDDTDESLNLSDVLLDRIRELEPDFEELISREN